MSKKQDKPKKGKQKEQVEAPQQGKKTAKAHRFGGGEPTVGKTLRLIKRLRDFRSRGHSAR